MKWRATDPDRENCRGWLRSMLPSERNSIMNIIHNFQLSKNMRTTRRFSRKIIFLNFFCRSCYFQTLKCCFSLLYSKEWTSLEVPDLYNILINHPHIKIDSPTTDEEIEKIINRFSATSVATPNSGHMTHTDVYCAILDIVIKVGIVLHCT